MNIELLICCKYPNYMQEGPREVPAVLETISLFIGSLKLSGSDRLEPHLNAIPNHIGYVDFPACSVRVTPK
jgi:hypothetical protein